MTGVMLQAFHWYLPQGGTLWREVEAAAADLAAAGFTAVWLPPAYKGHVGGYDVGYGVYDMYDLGEFDQKGTIPTKYGTRDEYLAAIRALQAAGIAVYADIVWNHRLGGDGSEVIRATPHSTHDRSRPSGPTREVEVWTRFDFAGRAGAHDARTLDHRHFDAVDFDERRPDEWDTIYLFEGKTFDDHVADEFGNYAYLMGCDVDQSNPEVQAMTIDWGAWYLDTTGVDGLRLDAVKHIPAWVLPIYLDALRAHSGREIPVVAEYWSADLGALTWFLTAVGDRMMLFDVPLHFAFHRAGLEGNAFDLRTIFDGSLVGRPPRHGGDVRRQPRLAADAGPRVDGRRLVQAAGLRPDPAAPRGLPVRVPRRLLRRGLHRAALGRGARRRRDGLAPGVPRRLPGRCGATSATPSRSTRSTTPT